MGIVGISRSLFEDTNLPIIASMPFTTTQIFVSHLIVVYFRQLFITALFVLPINFTFFGTTHLFSAYNVILSFIVCIMLPFLSLGIASILALPYFIIKKFINSNVIATSISIIILVATFGFIYTRIFEFICALLDSGKIVTLFNQQTMESIIRFTTHNFPANFLANLILKRNIVVSTFTLLGTTIGLFAIGIILVRYIFNLALRSEIPIKKINIKKHIDIPYRNQFLTLLNKEFTLVIRNADYTYMYFATSLVMPIMVYYTARMGSVLTASLIGNMPIGFAICTTVTLLYSTLTNTFCSTNISRDGYMSLSLKSMPFNPKLIMLTKIIFCLIISTSSIFISVIITAAFGFQTWGQATLCFISCFIIAFSQILFATRLDLNNPHFSNTLDGSIKEANSTISIVILIGLVVSFFVGGLLLLQAIGSIQSGALQTFAKLHPAIISILFPAILLGTACAFFFIGLGKKYSALDVEV